MQAGFQNNKNWNIDFVNREKLIDPLTGWTGSNDTSQQTHMEFKTKEDAVNFAKKNNMNYEIQEPHSKVVKPNSYANNFK